MLVSRLDKKPLLGRKKYFYFQLVYGLGRNDLSFRHSHTKHKTEKRGIIYKRDITVLYANVEFDIGHWIGSK